MSPAVLSFQRSDFRRFLIVFFFFLNKNFFEESCWFLKQIFKKMGLQEDGRPAEGTFGRIQ